MRDASDRARQQAQLDEQMARSAVAGARHRDRLSLVADPPAAWELVARFVTEPDGFAVDGVSPVTVASDLAMACCWGAGDGNRLEDLTGRVDEALARRALGEWSSEVLWAWPGLARVSYRRHQLEEEACWAQLVDAVPALEGTARGGFVDELLRWPDSRDGRWWTTLRTIAAHVAPPPATRPATPSPRRP